MQEALSLILTSRKPGARVCTYNPSSWEVGTRGAEDQGHSWLHSRFDAGLGCMRPCLKKETKSVRFGWRGDLAQGGKRQDSDEKEVRFILSMAAGLPVSGLG